jgi:DNA replication protein DnaC
MNTQATLEQLKQLRLEGMAQSYEAILGLPINQHPDAHPMLAQLTQHEIQSKAEKRTRMFLRLSRLRYVASIEQIACSPKRNLTKEQLSLLADCAWIDRAENLVITGATGCGKSFLACALGHQGCLLGYKTLYLNMNRFIEKITLSRLDGTFIKVLNQIEKVRLLILDDFGLQPLSSEIRLALLQILEDRYQRKSTLVASQLPVNKWHDYIADPTLADAILDRLTAQTHKIELKGESMRRKSKTTKPKNDNE